MSKNNKDFFKVKKEWSKIKDELLGKYLVPYLSKIFHTRRPTFLIDCFSGKGKFDCGELGSPLIILTCIKQCIEKYKKANETNDTPIVETLFIEALYADDLKKNITEHFVNIKQNIVDKIVVKGKFEDNIYKMLTDLVRTNREINLFLYIDPYGIKSLDLKLFNTLPKVVSSIELIINFNSFGFIRAACKVMKLSPQKDINEICNELHELDESVIDSIENLNHIVGGDFWQVIIQNYHHGLINSYQAEKQLTNEYVKNLRNAYNYVLQIPIKLKETQHPKYRLIHATNHPDGCILMADTMCNCSDKLWIDIQRRKQESLFQHTHENEFICDADILHRIKDILSQKSELVSLNDFIIDFYNQHGLLCNTSKLSSGDGSFLKKLERENYIEVIREPRHTPTGRPSVFWKESKVQSVKLKKMR